jgi:hypothetical protein
MRVCAFPADCPPGCPDSIPIAFRADQLHDEPRIVAGRHIFPKLGGFAQRGHHDIDLAVVVEIGAIIAP